MKSENGRMREVIFMCIQKCKGEPYTTWNSPWMSQMVPFSVLSAGDPCPFELPTIRTPRHPGINRVPPSTDDADALPVAAGASVRLQQEQMILR